MNSFIPCSRQQEMFPSIQPGTPMAMGPATQPFQSAGFMQAMPVLPTGMPTGQPFGVTPAASPVPVTGSTLGGAQIAPTTLSNPAYIPGFLKTQIGRRVRVEFLIGTGTTTDRIGTLVDVGASYILILLEDSDDILMGDLYSIKFVTLYH